ncbi:hypothetical protein [Sphingobium sp. B11D3D]|uniref:hypothetical protein n=1 Tax=Sphingobium sp. B11D3D TaxID=2940576 RepID=UPI0022244DFB|nr:hypothetical protein [Sphingobium sp. B11D3D]MCW2369933.1 hypothetical protein [Sphingobium sp. B11D3D]
MAGDLSRLEVRAGAQRRLTTGQSSVLPRQANTDAPRLEINADMRAARRSSAEADELRRVFGLVSNAAQSFQEYAEAAHRNREAQLAGDGATAFATGTVDPALMERSSAYRDSVTTGQAMRGLNDTKARIAERVQQRFADPNSLPDLEDIDGIIDEELRAFATVDGTLRDFGSVSANRAVGSALIEAKPKWIEEARATITKQVDERSLQFAAANLADAAAEGRVDLEDALRQVSPGVDKSEAKAALIDSVQEFAMRTLETEPQKALAALDALLTSKREDGTPSLSANEREKLRAERLKMGEEAERNAERAEAKRHETNAETLLDRFNRVPGSGGYPTTSELLRLRSEGQISAQFTSSMLTALRADREANGAGVVNRAGGGRPAGFDPDEHPTAQALVSEVFSGRMTANQASVAALRLLGQGYFGEGPDKYKVLANLNKNLNAVRTLESGVRNALSLPVQDWLNQAKRAASSIRDPKRRRLANIEADDAAKRMLERALKASREGRDPAAYIDTMGRAAAGALVRKYGL